MDGVEPAAAARVGHSFTRSFDSYHAAAQQQAAIAARLVDELCSAQAPNQFRSVVELGCGTGHLTHRLRDTFKIDALTLNDLSPQAQATADTYTARFLAGDVTQIALPRNADLLASASMIQWLPDPGAFLRRAASHLAPGGWLAVSGFGPQQYRELAELGSTAKAPGLCTPEELREALSGYLNVMAVGESVLQSTFETPQKVLKHLRKTGVNGRAGKRWTKANLAQFVHGYERLFSNPSGVTLTYHPVWIIARKSQQAPI